MRGHLTKQQRAKKAAANGTHTAIRIGNLQLDEGSDEKLPAWI